MERRLLTIADVAARLRVSKVTAYRLAGRAGFPALRVGSLIRVPETELEAWINRTRTNPDIVAASAGE